MLLYNFVRVFLSFCVRFLFRSAPGHVFIEFNSYRRSGRRNYDARKSNRRAKVRRRGIKPNTDTPVSLYHYTYVGIELLGGGVRN